MLPVPRCFAGLMVALALDAAPVIPPLRPDVQGVFPHGGQRGTEVVVSIKGRNLQNVNAIAFATPRIQAAILENTHNFLKARIRVDSAAEPGRRDFRIVAPQGSTIAWFEVSDRPESLEKEPNNSRDTAQAIQFPILLNGIVKPRDYDYFRFEARKGQTLTFDVTARRNNAPLDPTIDLLDDKGSVLEWCDDYYAFKDTHLVYTFGRAGVYFLRLYGTGESGNDNGDYRLRAGEMPHAYYAMPMGAPSGSVVEFRLAGVNLQDVNRVVLGEDLASGEVLATSPTSATVRMAIPGSLPPGRHKLHIDGAALPVPFVVGDIPQATVARAGRQLARGKRDPYPVTLPVVVNGVIDEARAADYFSFRVDGPETVSLTVDSMQLGYLLDPMVALYDEDGKRLAWQDEPTTNTGRDPSNFDPHLVFQLPKAGRYTAMVRDSQFRGDANYAYRLTLRKARPDFQLTVIGTDETLYRGVERIVKVRVRRLDGWNTPVAVWAENLPPGVTASKAVAQPEPTPFKNTCGEEHLMDGTNVELLFAVAANAEASFQTIRIRGRGAMEGRTIEREAHTRYWWRTNQSVRGLAETADMRVTVAEAPQLVLAVPARLNLPPKAPGKLDVVVTRLDSGQAPLRIEAAEAAEGLSLDPADVPAGATQAQLTVSLAREGRVSLVLVGKSGGKILGQSPPIVVETSAKGASSAADEN
ncbi:MAG: DVUA0089 family protein [Bryobacteraceae bacterium]